MTVPTARERFPVVVPALRGGNRGTTGNRSPSRAVPGTAGNHREPLGGAPMPERLLPRRRCFPGSVEPGSRSVRRVDEGPPWAI